MTTTFRFRRPTTLTELAVLAPELGLRIQTAWEQSPQHRLVLAHTDAAGNTNFVHLGRTSRATGRPALELTAHGANDAASILGLLEPRLGEALPIFDSEQAACAWLQNRPAIADDGTFSHYRFAFLDDLVQMVEYEDIFQDGCCGYSDHHVFVGDRLAAIGCCYGH